MTLKMVCLCATGLLVLYLVTMFWFGSRPIGPGDVRAQLREQSHEQQRNIDLAAALGEVRLKMWMTFDEIQSTIHAQPTRIVKGGSVVNEIDVEWYEGLVSASFVGSGGDLDPRHAGFPIRMGIREPVKGSIDGAQVGVSCSDARGHFNPYGVPGLTGSATVSYKLECHDGDHPGISVSDTRYELKPL